MRSAQLLWQQNGSLRQPGDALSLLLDQMRRHKNFQMAHSFSELRFGGRCNAMYGEVVLQERHFIIREVEILIVAVHARSSIAVHASVRFLSLKNTSPGGFYSHWTEFVHNRVNDWLATPPAVCRPVEAIAQAGVSDELEAAFRRAAGMELPAKDNW
jgi:hypothetical protein